VFIN